MKTKPTFRGIRLLLILVSLLYPFSNLPAAEFNAMVVPSLMDSDMDAWYRIPADSLPCIHKAHRVYRDQPFNLLIFFKGYAVGKKNNIHLRYDVQVYDPQGKPTEDKGSDLAAYRGTVKNPNALLLNRQYLRIAFTEKYPPGTYKIKVTAYDKIANKSFTSETALELLPFTLAVKFLSKDDVGKWVMRYYKSPTPIKAINGVQLMVNADLRVQSDQLSILAFFRRVYSDNPFLLKNIAKHFDTFSLQDKKKFLLISAISRYAGLKPAISRSGKELKTFYRDAKKLKFPRLKGEITTSFQLDILWAEFLASGKYAPVKKIVGALALKKYKGISDKVKAGEIENVSQKIKRQAELGATYTSVVWSLTSNCKQLPLVFKYCAFMYMNEKLHEDIKSQLGAILQVVVQEMQKEKEQESPKGAK
ncbi:MAG: hypothetical protein GY765_31260 [bacterium]|nr:hypothetical protein [bacterium]